MSKKAKPGKKNRASKQKDAPTTPGAWRRPLMISAVIAVVSIVGTLIVAPNLIFIPILVTCALGAWVLSTILK